VSDLMLSCLGKARHDPTPQPSRSGINLIFSVSEFRFTPGSQSSKHSLPGAGTASKSGRFPLLCHRMRSSMFSMALQWGSFGAQKQDPLHWRAWPLVSSCSPTPLKEGTNRDQVRGFLSQRAALGLSRIFFRGAGRAQNSTKSEENFLHPSCCLLRGWKKRLAQLAFIGPKRFFPSGAPHRCCVKAMLQGHHVVLPSTLDRSPNVHRRVVCTQIDHAVVLDVRHGRRSSDIHSRQ
jgi:hypothetical protein